VSCGKGIQTRAKYLETLIPPGTDPRDLDFKICGSETFKDMRHCFAPKCTGNLYQNVNQLREKYPLNDLLLKFSLVGNIDSWQY